MKVSTGVGAKYLVEDQLELRSYREQLEGFILKGVPTRIGQRTPLVGVC